MLRVHHIVNETFGLDVLVVGPNSKVGLGRDLSGEGIDSQLGLLCRGSSGEGHDGSNCSGADAKSAPTAME